MAPNCSDITMHGPHSIVKVSEMPPLLIKRGRVVVYLVLKSSKCGCPGIGDGSL